MALQRGVQIKALEGDALVAADVSNDGKVDASDALLILQHSVNLIDQLPGRGIKQHASVYQYWWAKAGKHCIDQKP